MTVTSSVLKAYCASILLSKLCDTTLLSSLLMLIISSVLKAYCTSILSSKLCDTTLLSSLLMLPSLLLMFLHYFNRN